MTQESKHTQNQEENLDSLVSAMTLENNTPHLNHLRMCKAKYSKKAMEWLTYLQTYSPLQKYLLEDEEGAIEEEDLQDFPNA